MDDFHDRDMSEEALRFNDFAEESFSWRYIENPSLRELIRRHVAEDTSVLDLGCGTGRIVQMLLSLGISSKSIHAIDKDQSAPAIARQKFPTVSFLEHDLGDTPYPVTLRAINLITAHLVLQYLTPTVMSECLIESRRLLVPGGLLVLGLPHPIRVAAQAETPYFARQTHQIPVPWGGLAPCAGITISDYLNLIMTSGFKLAKIEEPEILEEGLAKSESTAYYGPTRLMILATA